MAKITSQRHDRNVYRMLDGSTIVGFALQMATGMWAPFDTEDKRLPGTAVATPKLVANWFNEQAAAKELAALPAVKDMLFAGDDVVRLSVMIRSDIMGRIGGDAAVALYAMVDENRETWKAVTGAKKGPDAIKVAHALVGMATRASELSAAHFDHTDGDGRTKFNHLTHYIIRTVEALFGPLPQAPAPASAPGL